MDPLRQATCVGDNRTYALMPIGDGVRLIGGSPA